MDILARNNVSVQGRGPRTMLFAHGFGCDQNMWRHVAPPFEAESLVVLFDHVGAGASDWSAYSSDKYRSLHGYAEDVIEICEAAGLSDVIFVGHSVSATIGVLAAVRRPDLFSHLVLICPSPRYSDCEGYVGGFAERDIDDLLDLMDKNHLDWSAMLAPTVMGAGHEVEQQEWQDSVCRTDPAVAKEFARATFKSDHREDYAQVRVPTLVIECSDDALAPQEVGQFVNRVIAGSELLTLKAEGHCPHITSPAEVVAALRALMNVMPVRAVA